MNIYIFIYIVQQGSRLNERAHAVGFPSLNENRICSNTIKSHRLVRWISKVYGFKKSEDIFELLNYEHFINGRKLNDSNFLIDCCKRINDKTIAEATATSANTAGPAVATMIDIDAARNHLMSDDGRNEVLATIQSLNNMQVSSIPIFVINSFWGIEGAVTSNRFMSVFRDIEEHILESESRGQPVNTMSPFLFGRCLGIE